MEDNKNAYLGCLNIQSLCLFYNLYKNIFIIIIIKSLAHSLLFLILFSTPGGTIILQYQLLIVN